MKTPALSTVYLDHERVGLMGDPRPLVAKVVAAAGHTLDVKVVRNQSLDDRKGTPLQLDDVIDRTADPSKPVYLTCTPNPKTASTADGATGSATDRQLLGRVPLPRGPKVDRDPEWRT